MVLTVHGGLIGEVTGFAAPALFGLFARPAQVAWAASQAG
jgi:hypothetical protein